MNEKASFTSNPQVERLTGSLWMITKPGGYTHINQLGRVYREKSLALRHKDYDEVVVELRLAVETSDMQKELGKLRSQIDRLDGLWNLVAENRNGAYDKTDALLYVKQYSPLEPLSPHTQAALDIVARDLATLPMTVVSRDRPEEPTPPQMWYCSNCRSGNRVDFHHTSCPACGKLRPAEKASERPCSKCRAVNVHSLDHCANCGSPLNGEPEHG